MLTFCFFVLGVILIVLQTTLLQFAPEGFGRPDFIFLLVAFSAYRFAWLPGIFLTFTLGWIFDVLVGLYLGIYPLECLLVFAGLKLITTNSPVKESAYQIPLVGISYFVMHLLVYFLTSFTLPDALPEWSWPRIIQDTLLLVAAAIPCFLLFNSLYEYIRKRALSSRRIRRRPARHL